jgi:hypothetical protein
VKEQVQDAIKDSASLRSASCQEVLGYQIPTHRYSKRSADTKYGIGIGLISMSVAFS